VEVLTAQKTSAGRKSPHRAARRRDARNEEDFSAALGYDVPGMMSITPTFEVEGYKQMIAKVVKDYPFKVVPPRSGKLRLHSE